MSETIHTSAGGDLMYVDELIEALEDAREGAGKASDEANQDDVFFFVHDQDGRGAKRVLVTVDTLSDGSKAFNVEIQFEH